MQRAINSTKISQPGAGDLTRTPRAALWSAGLGIAALVAGAVYLIVVRGDALMLDLSALSRFAFCF